MTLDYMYLKSIIGCNDRYAIYPDVFRLDGNYLKTCIIQFKKILLAYPGIRRVNA